MTQGSGNPGAHNAFRTGGPGLAALVLAVEAGKGFGAVMIGEWMADDAGMIAAGLGAAAGNVYNIWYRFSGGKGLGISLGILAGAWPAVVLAILGVILVAVFVSRSAAIAALTAIACLLMMSLVWAASDWPTGGVESGPGVVILAMGLTALLAWKNWRDAPFSGQNRPLRRASESPGRR